MSRKTAVVLLCIGVGGMVGYIFGWPGAVAFGVGLALSSVILDVQDED